MSNALLVLNERQWLTATGALALEMLAHLGGPGLTWAAWKAGDWPPGALVSVRKLRLLAQHVMGDYAVGRATLDGQPEDKYPEYPVLWLSGWINSCRAMSEPPPTLAVALPHLLRCVAGNPFRRVITNPKQVLRPGPGGGLVADLAGVRLIDVRPWLAWNGGTVPRLAQGVYDDRAFERLPVLADALEDAGCADNDVLTHLRYDTHHCRGCWAVDLLLGKE